MYLLHLRNLFNLNRFLILLQCQPEGFRGLLLLLLLILLPLLSVELPILTLLLLFIKRSVTLLVLLALHLEVVLDVPEGVHELKDRLSHPIRVVLV